MARPQTASTVCCDDTDTLSSSQGRSSRQVLQSALVGKGAGLHQYGGGSRSPRWREVVNPVRSGRKQP